MDNTRINSNTTPGDIIATEDVGGIKYQRIKLVTSKAGLTTPIGNDDTPLPIKRSCLGTDFANVQLLDQLPHEIMLHGAHLPCMIWADALGGDVIKVEYRVSAGVTPQPWAHGPVSAYADIELSAPVYSIIFTLTGTSGLSRAGITQ